VGFDEGGVWGDGSSLDDLMADELFDLFIDYASKLSCA
jgi:hypothetical protein